ncbi:hypothetical protein K491DRAFT_448441 [Lophiostoma macrostomum CBS 122681]|uniref:Uncharacterized protein n=1 Tax=Lophiostoma macrostomum CBS 122681 TaxID=1314788 RepID=A0A6A6TNB5_9PLEO|nr:hypothetical protein K491DRAFT_448441 [Lophiostoma macrostomum CBS 122681]
MGASASPRTAIFRRGSLSSGKMAPFFVIAFVAVWAPRRSLRLQYRPVDAGLGHLGLSHQAAIFIDNPTASVVLCTATGCLSTARASASFNSSHATPHHMIATWCRYPARSRP